MPTRTDAIVRRRLVRGIRSMSLLAGFGVAAGCASPIGAPAPPMERPGPILVAAITNRSDQERVFSYEFEAADRSSTGSGEGVVSACTSMVESWSEITGSYTLRLDDDVLAEDRLAPGQGDGAYIVVHVQVGPGGHVEVLPPALVGASPALGSGPVQGCK